MRDGARRALAHLHALVHWELVLLGQCPLRLWQLPFWGQTEREGEEATFAAWPEPNKCEAGGMGCGVRPEEEKQPCRNKEDGEGGLNS